MVFKDCFVNTSVYSIVVARYEEDIDWLFPFAKNCIIYNKGGDNININFNWKNTINLPNVGREAHTYLHHIINNYDELSGIILFTQGNISDHLPESYKNDEINYLMKLISSANINGCSFNAYQHSVGSMSAHKNLKMADKWKNLGDSSMTFGEWMNDIFNDQSNQSNKSNKYKFNHRICWYMNSVFAIDSEMIKKHPKSFYEKLISYVDNHKDPEAGHYFERAWYEIFNYFNDPL